MMDFLRHLTTTQQIGALFVAMFGLLSLVTLYAFFQTLREARGPGPEDQAAGEDQEHGRGEAVEERHPTLADQPLRADDKQRDHRLKAGSDDKPCDSE